MLDFSTLCWLMAASAAFESIKAHDTSRAFWCESIIPLSCIRVNVEFTLCGFKIRKLRLQPLSFVDGSGSLIGSASLFCAGLSHFSSLPETNLDTGGEGIVTGLEWFIFHAQMTFFSK